MQHFDVAFLYFSDLISSIPRLILFPPRQLFEVSHLLLIGGVVDGHSLEILLWRASASRQVVPLTARGDRCVWLALNSVRAAVFY